MKNAGKGMFVVLGSAERGEELNMPPGDHGIPMTSAEQVLFAVILKIGWRWGLGVV